MKTYFSLDSSQTMKSAKHILILFILAALTTTCEKLEGPAKNVFQTWEVVDFVSVESLTYSKYNNSRILLTINSDKTYNLSLDINTCGGSILSISELGIVFGNPACTEACCDSDFASRFTELLPFINMYKVDGDTLRLSIPDWGFIECVRVD